MILTNNFDLPEAIYNVMMRDIYQPTRSRMRVTELINAPLIKELMIKHWKELTEDCSDGLWRLLGTSVHYILESGTPDNALGEERLSFTIGDTTISGKSDLYHNEGIEDWKVTSVFSFLLGEKPEWIAQLNMYKWLWEKNGFPVKSLKINAILRDWQRSKAKFDPTYPQIPFLSFDVPIWNNSIITEYIFDRIAEHAIKPARECTDDQKWKRPTTYAVMKEGAKRARRVLDTEKEAEKYIKDLDEDKQKGLFVDKRQGLCVKCEDYCIVRDFCPYYKKVIV